MHATGDRRSAAIVRVSRWVIPSIGCWVRAAGRLDDRTLLARLGCPPLEPEDDGDPLLLYVATFGEWIQVRDPRGHDLSTAIARRDGERDVGEPIYALDSLVRDFDVYAHDRGDPGYFFELYRDAQLARRVYVGEREPWSRDLYVRDDIGERLPGEPPPSDAIPLGDEDSQGVMIEVLRHLGALPDSLDAPVEYFEYRCHPGEILERYWAQRRADIARDRASNRRRREPR